MWPANFNSEWNAVIRSPKYQLAHRSCDTHPGQSPSSQRPRPTNIHQTLYLFLTPVLICLFYYTMNPDDAPDDVAPRIRHVDLRSFLSRRIGHVPGSNLDTDAPIPMDGVLPVAEPLLLERNTLSADAAELRAALSSAVPVATALVDALGRVENSVTALNAAVQAVTASCGCLNNAMNHMAQLRTPVNAVPRSKGQEGLYSGSTRGDSTPASSSNSGQPVPSPSEQQDVDGAGPGTAAENELPSVLIDHGSLLDLVHSLLDACPVNPSLFRAHVRSLCKKVGYACFTRRGLRRFAVEAFKHFEGDPPTPPQLRAFRKMIPHLAGVFWDERYQKNEKEKFSVCGEHCQDEVKRIGHSHALLD